MVIFGAGASYDSAPSCRPGAEHDRITPLYRPPLANQLFADRPDFANWILRFPACQAVIPYLRQPLEGSSVEGELERLRNEALTNPKRHRQITAVQFYLQSMLWECEEKWKGQVAKGVTNYRTLLDQIESWRREEAEKVCLVTFNYDRMLEDALSEVAINIRGVDDYIASDDYRMIKLHGSVNWAHRVGIEIKDPSNRPRLLILNELIERRGELRIHPDYHMISGALGDPAASCAQKPELPLFPALAIPVENKQEYECPLAHLEALRICIPEVTKILLIGWRATEKVFLQSLKNNLRGRVQMMAVNGSEASSKESMRRLVQEGIQGTLLPTKSGFSDFVTRREAEPFLRSS